MLSALLLLCAGASPSCYRAEIDLGLLAAASPEPGGEAGGNGAAEPACDDTQVDDEQAQCRLGDLPTRAECTEQDRDGWSGCYNGGCAVCRDSVAGYPYYFDWHPCCIVNTSCNSNGPVKCNARCPAPTEHDKVRPCWRVDATP
jgi:hypothetical protein